MQLLKIHRNYYIVFALAFLLSLIHCTTPSEDKPARLKISLIDSPGDYEQVNVEILDVQVKYNGGEWTSFAKFEPGIYNLLEFTGGHELFITDEELAANTLSLDQLRLMLGTNNSIMIRSYTYDLTIPSGQESGVKTYVNQILTPGKENRLMIDFDVSRSVVKASNSGLFLLRPVIKAINPDETGSISGKVKPQNLNVAIQVNSDSKIYATTYAPAGTSEFLVSGLPEGVYMVIFDPGSDSGYQQFSTDENIVVKKGTTINLGSITILPNQ